MIRFDVLGGMYEFDPEDGGLQHPCGFLTSWFVLIDGEWNPIEWATDMPDTMKQMILNAINNSC